MKGVVKSPVVIGISANLFPAEDRVLYKNKPLYLSEASLCDAVIRAGALPVMLPFVTEESAISGLLGRVDGLVLSGGVDVAPEMYGNSAMNERWRGQPERDAFELALYCHARRREMPILGICRGFQFINVAEGGTLWQDIPSLRPDSLQHRNQEIYDGLHHGLNIEPTSFLADLFGVTTTQVNSVHHQGIHTLAPGLTPLAYAPDGLIEAVMLRQSGLVVGVQWHPEWMVDSAPNRGLFEWFIARVVEAGQGGHVG